MKHLDGNARVAASTVVCMFLAGCGGGPSAGDVEKAVRTSVDATNQQVLNIGGDMAKGMLTELHSAKKVDCAEAKGSAGFTCDVEVDVTAPMAGRSQRVVQLRFVETDDGWRAAE